MYRIIKFFNKRINEMLCVRMKIMLWAGVFPRARYENHFVPVRSLNWCSAPDDYESYYHSGGSVDFPYLINIRTEMHPGVGKDCDGRITERKYRTAKLRKAIDSRGRFVVLAEFDPNTKNHWEAIWFYGLGGRYREVDMERTEQGKVIFSVHDGIDADNGRRLYNHEYPLFDNVVEFTFRLRPITMIYMNGILVFVGLQWRMPKNAEAIISSGVQGGKVANDGFFKIHGYKTLKYR